MKRILLLVPAALFVTAFASACGDGPDNNLATVSATSTSAPATRSAATATVTQAPGTPVVLQNPTVTPSGLKYVDQVAGTGATPQPTDQVTVNYTGKLASNGQVFDSSVQRGQPATFRMNGVIKGFAEALSTMKEGGKRTVFIPAALAYGAQGTQGIPPNSDLVFDIELIKVAP